MTKTYAQLQREIQTLQKEADKLKKKEVEEVIGRIKEAIQVYGLTARDLGLNESPRRKQKPSSRAREKVKPSATAVKFRDEAGHVWGGRGPRPRWLRDELARGKSLADFAV